MLGKLKASLGIGAAKVDTVLQNMSVTQGDTLKGTVHIQGGDVEQQIDAIKLKLCTQVKVESDSGTSYPSFVLGHLQAVDPFVIGPGQEKQVDFELKLHEETPVTALNALHNQCHVWVETTLDIDFAIDPKDRDFVEVKPLPVVSSVISAIESAGFTMVKADVEKGHLRANTFQSKSGCYQEIEFRNNGFVTSKEIELSFILDGNMVHCLAEVDRAMSLRGDQYVAFSLDRNASAGQIQDAVSRVLSV
ncbi:putative Sporulation control stage 0, protein M family protein [Vibrio nigripulchritudo SFn27]|uniref:Sporulation control stage 0, protein M family protein n=2 Tax=Vibrio nigripulchritudo TaxID=28173 RepID=A0AAV2VXZ1_9VIBR|nr:sporulation protein [Vibrio nigripulchritudo]CCN83062.1 putative Sporulation control stage 0, protein M family protein [Vibrio nigripulchritudo BLFn1]CCN90670.1 putative Sporulation control stage 0, protein M family protein [Vibrio nigripulchritudo SFn27]CCN97257.1 putative Sporulation control stage 0, protein M family protein [Vibrio nigripulchritudo ENn2]CCO39892.1 putative Sporulation control stage 0, protein M family protein [Vibrio nigripulchritudo SFn135]CCO49481.1 putative Sporulatio